MLAIILGYGLFAQTPPYNIGFVGTTSKDANSMKVTVAGGPVVGTTWQSLPDGRVMAGFAPHMIYKKRTFEKPLFVSKGYFGGYTEISWNVNNNLSDITGFQIFRKKYESPEDSVLVAALAGNARSWQDHYGEANQIYEYTLYVQGITNDFVLEYINISSGIGFRVPTATVSGRITYEGGVAVEGVRVLAETEDIFSNYSVWLNGEDSYISIPDSPENNYLDTDTAITINTWIRPDQAADRSVIFSKGDRYRLSYQKGRIIFQIKEQELLLDFIEKPDTFFHITATWSQSENLARLYIMYNEDLYWEAEKTIIVTDMLTDASVLVGRDIDGSWFRGYVKDVRVYNTALTKPQVLNSFGRLLSGTEAGMVAYMQLNEGKGNLIFDRARRGFTFYENHGSITNGQWKPQVPTLQQLSYKGITNHAGNYIISGIPYSTDGSVYHITPMYQNHQFDPDHALLFMSSSSSTHNNINFTDISSFKVSGNIRYKDTRFPVEGVSFKVDDRTVVDAGGRPITTDINGDYEIRVPIGFHVLTAEKTGHRFEQSGRFPVDPGLAHDFQQPISSLNFIDETLIKVTGRMAGGPVQAAKPITLGQTLNNIGYGVLTLTTQKMKDLSDMASVVSNGWDQIIYQNRTPEKVGETRFTIDNNSPRNILIEPDTATGEFVAWLLPEKYIITKATAGDYTFDDSFHVIIDLTNSFNNYVSIDTLYSQEVINGVAVDVMRIDSATYQYAHELIYRENPSISVARNNDDPVFWEKEVKARNGASVAVTDAAGNPKTPYPVLFQRNQYELKISVFEEYINASNGQSDMVPVTDGAVEIQNQLAIDQRLLNFPIRSDGTVLYQFTGGLPNIATGGIGDYILTMAIVARTGNNGVISTPWLYKGYTFRAYLFGGMPTGNNFVTSGPHNLVTILRDPPGSQSYSSLETGEEISSTTQHIFEPKLETSLNVNVDLGAKIITWAGVGAGVITETETVANMDIGLEGSYSVQSDSTTTTTFSNTREWKTSEETDFVGSAGDLFVGYGTNIVYGISTQIDLMPSDFLNGEGFVDAPFEYEGIRYDVGVTKGIRISPEISTMFMFTQYHIESYLLPNLQMLRKNVLLTNSNYQCVICDPEHPDFGLPNTSGVETATGYTDGDSYNFTFPAAWPADSLFVDSVDYFNTQIQEWTDLLSRNEEEKVTASLENNFSFDGGSAYTSTMTTSEVKERNRTVSWSIAPIVAEELGFEILGTGTTWKYEMKTTYTTTDASGHSVTNNTTYSYQLKDSNAGDYMSVDVKKATTPTGPVFGIAGGQTMCPYEDAVYTKYYLPGTIISQATMKREVPVISCENPIMANVPEDSPAIFNVQLTNLSETNDDQWFKLIVEEGSNQNGAMIMMDGSPIGNGRVVMVPAGMSINKTISVKKVKPDFYDYENLLLILQSQCEESNADSIAISAYFQPVCSFIRLNQPIDQWVVNTVTGTDMNINFDSYNLNHSTFRKVLFQYKPSSGSLWSTEMTFYVYEDEFLAAPEPKSFIGGNPLVNYTWDMSSLIDRWYDVRVTSICLDGTINHSQIRKGIKDTRRPQVFGTPQPGNGFLSPGNNVMVTFNEPIVGQMLTPYNFSVRGVLNGYDLNHNTSLFFDGVSSYATIRNGVNLRDNSFTIEFWLNRSSSGQTVVFSQGHDLEAGFTSSDKFYLRLGSQEIATAGAFAQTDQWVHWGVVYNWETQKVSFYRDDSRVLEEVTVVAPFETSGNLLLGKSFGGENLLHGSVHELRIWNREISMSVFYQNSMKSLKGDEMGLIGYWPMHEARGQKALDHSRAQHAQLYNLAWQVLPLKYSRQFNGINDHILINTASSVIIMPETDFTIEFWFKGEAQVNTTLFSNGKGDGTDRNPSVRNALSVGFDEFGMLTVLNNGSSVTSHTDLLDNAWHHVGIVMNRQANLSLYVDNQLQAYSPASHFSGMAGSQMALGARRYQEGENQVSDNYFKGYIDEFRIWNLARKLTQIEMESNSKLKGHEMGLVAYYPFEHYEAEMGVMLLKPTLADGYIPPFGGWVNGGMAVATGGDFSRETPTIKDARPLENVQFSWIPSEDQIVINVEEAPEAIEKVVLEFTVSNVEDDNENRMASPVTWTAFVKQNTVLWDQDRISFEKELYAPMTFQVRILNVGGIDQNYQVSNLPAWLSCSQIKGNLTPDSYYTLEFTVNEALNIGNYAVSLYLTGDFGYNEKLDLYLKVFKPAPNWTVNPEQYRFSSSITGQLYIDNLLSSNEDNLIAAFKDGQCRGVARLEYVEAYDAYMAFLDVYSNQELGETIDLRVWDAARGQIITKVSPTIDFSAHSNLGTPSAPLPIYALSYFEGRIALNKGWSWISFNLASPDLNDLSVLFKDVTLGNNNLVKSQHAFDQYAAQSDQWMGNLSSSQGMSNQGMYMVMIDQSDTLVYEGPMANVQEPLNLVKGWNWIGYSPQISMEINEAFAFFHPNKNDLVKNQYQFSIFDGNLGWIGSLTMLQPGRGYMYFASEAGQLIYPSSGVMSKSSDQMPAHMPWSLEQGSGPSTMSILAQIWDQDQPANKPYMLAAFAEDECRGIATGTRIGDRILYFLSAGEDPGQMSLTFKLYDSEKGSIIPIKESLAFTTDQMAGSFEEPLKLSPMEADVSQEGVSIFPNPFASDLYIVFDQDPGYDTEVTISDVTGRIIYRFDPSATAGKMQLKWNGHNAWGLPVGPGIYLLTIRGSNLMQTHQIIRH